MTFSIKSTAGRGGFAPSQPSFNPNSIAGSGTKPVGEPQSPAGSRLLPHTAASWTHEREQEAREAGYDVKFHRDPYGQLVAVFWNGPYVCLTRVWTP